jgi:Tol biopolymer transport system component
MSAAHPRSIATLALAALLVVGVGTARPAARGSAANGRILVSTGRSHEFSLVGLEPGSGRALPFDPYDARGQEVGEYSPDGTKIAFASARDGDYDIYVMNADGSGVRQITSNSSPDNFPTWSPDGTRIAFTSGRDGDFDIYVAGADGSNPVDITSSSPGPDDNPHWSPDGAWIAYDTFRYGSWDVVLTTPDGSQLYPVTTDPGFDWFDDWSPDGKRFLVDSNRSGDDGVYVFDLVGEIPGDGYLTEPSYLLSKSPAAEGSAAWSPDGSHIAFASNRDGDFEVFVVNADGSGERQLTHNDRDDIVDDWQPLHDVQPPTARALASTGRAGHTVALRYVSVDDSGSTSIEVTLSRGKQPFWSSRTGQRPASAGKQSTFSLRLPRALKGKSTFCVQAYDASGNESPRSCAGLTLS